MRNNKYYNEDESKSVTVKLAQPRYIPPPLAKSVKVIGSLYCAPYPVDLILANLTDDCEYVVYDNVNCNMIFKFKPAFFTLRGKYVLVDSADNPILTMQAKTRNIFGSSRWQVYKGDSTDNHDLLFSVQKSSSIRESSSTDLDVFLVANTEENICDFKIKGAYHSSSSWKMKSCVVCLGHSSVNIAQMHVAHFGKLNVVNVNPHVDYAFIIALMKICQLIPRTLSDDTVSESKKANSSCESKDIDGWKCD